MMHCNSKMAASMGVSGPTSFQKKRRTKFVQIPGTRPSLHNGQLLVSTGVPSLDFVIGGGLAVGTVLLVEEDKYRSYADLLVKYFVAEGIISNHEIFLAAADKDPEKIIKDLPHPLDDDLVKSVYEEREEAGDGAEKMKIAWRYEHLPKHQSNQGGVKFGHHYDLSRTIDEELIKRVKCTCHCANKHLQEKKQLSMNPSYEDVIHSVQRQIRQGGYDSPTTEAKDKNILRIAISSIGSPLWGEEGGVIPGTAKTDHSLPRFLHALRSILRSSLSVCLITIPTHLFQDAAFVRRLENLCDTVVKLESFAGSEKEKNPVYKEYHGLFTICKLPRLNSLTCHMPDSLDLAFKLKRKKFTIEKLHLPPDLSETVSRSQGEVIKTASADIGCASKPSNQSLDF
ncbi:elongator complex protein 4-like isoform X1 [Ptychodera flava]|uniref:elongator complex protein 4-like isoform X1 n=1 Tax=Ptychodera flava TaxID=63121 RepID=UPI00396A2309